MGVVLALARCYNRYSVTNTFVEMRFFILKINELYFLRVTKFRSGSGEMSLWHVPTSKTTQQVDKPKLVLSKPPPLVSQSTS